MMKFITIVICTFLLISFSVDAKEKKSKKNNKDLLSLLNNEGSDLTKSSKNKGIKNTKFKSSLFKDNLNKRSLAIEMNNSPTLTATPIPRNIGPTPYPSYMNGKSVAPPVTSMANPNQKGMIKRFWDKLPDYSASRSLRNMERNLNQTAANNIGKPGFKAWAKTNSALIGETASQVFLSPAKSLGTEYGKLSVTGGTKKDWAYGTGKEVFNTVGTTATVAGVGGLAFKGSTMAGGALKSTASTVSKYGDLTGNLATESFTKATLHATKEFVKSDKVRSAAKNGKDLLSSNYYAPVKKITSATMQRVTPTTYGRVTNSSVVQRVGQYDGILTKGSKEYSKMNTRTTYMNTDTGY